MKRRSIILISMCSLLSLGLASQGVFGLLWFSDGADERTSGQISVHTPDTYKIKLYGYDDELSLSFLKVSEFNVTEGHNLGEIAYDTPLGYYQIEGWYLESTYATKVGADYVPTGDLNLYAKYVNPSIVRYEDLEGEYFVNVTSEYTSDVNVTSSIIETGSKVLGGSFVKSGEVNVLSSSGIYRFKYENNAINIERRVNVSVNNPHFLNNQASVSVNGKIDDTEYNHLHEVIKNNDTYVGAHVYVNPLYEYVNLTSYNAQGGVIWKTNYIDVKKTYNEDYNTLWVCNTKKLGDDLEAVFELETTPLESTKTYHFDFTSFDTATNNWTTGARIYAHCWGDNLSDLQLEITVFNKEYVVTLPLEYTHMLLVRMPDSYDHIDWDAKWNQTEDIDLTIDRYIYGYRITSWSGGQDGKSTVAGYYEN